MKTLYVVALLINFSLAMATAKATEKPTQIVLCQTESVFGVGGSIELTQSHDGQFSVNWTDSTGKVTTYNNVVKNQDAEVTEQMGFSETLAEINHLHDTGIDYTKIKYFRTYFLEGNDDFHSNMFEFFDAQKKSLGWITFLFNVGPSGCYQK
jgi:hypothetical protein